MRLGLVDASTGKIGSPIDHVLLFCFHYDPAAATYSASILKLIRLGGVLTILGLVVGFVIFRRRDLAPSQTNSRPRKGGPNAGSLSESTEQGAH
jgi:protein SCO1/2